MTSRISFGDAKVTGVLRPGLMRAAWGNLKKAIFLNQLVFAAKNTAKARGDESLKVVTFAFDRSAESLKSLGLSEPTLISYLKEFSAVNYVSAPAYAREISVDLAMIEAAELNPPARPSRSVEEKSESLKFKTLNSGKKRESLKAKVQKLEEEVQTFKLFVQAFKDIPQIFKLFPKEFKLLNFSESAPQAVAASLSEAPRFLDSIRIQEILESNYDAPAFAGHASSLSFPGEEGSSYSHLGLQPSSSQEEKSSFESISDSESQKISERVFTPEFLGELDQKFDELESAWLYENREAKGPQTEAPGEKSVAPTSETCEASVDENSGELFPGLQPTGMTLPEWKQAEAEFINQLREEWKHLPSLQRKQWKNLTTYKKHFMLPWYQAHPQPRPDYKSKPGEIYKRLVERRGWQHESTGLIAKEMECIKQWCRLHPLEDYDLVINALTDPKTGDKFWRQEINARRIDGRILLEQTPLVLAKQTIKVLPTATFANIPDNNGRSSEEIIAAIPQLEAELAAMGIAV